jgi:hypothetical protein
VFFQDFGKEFQCPVERLGLDENFIDVSKMVAARRTSKADWKVAGHVYGGEVNARSILT